MAQSRKRASSPLFYDIESDTLYPGVQEKKIRYEEICRVCASPATLDNDFIDIFSRSGKALNIPSKINKFLPITVTVNDGLSHMICSKCRDILNSIDTLCSVCEKADEFFNSTENLEVVQEFDEDYEDPDLPFENTSPNIPTTIIKCDVSPRKSIKEGIPLIKVNKKASKISIVDPSATWITDVNCVENVVLNVEEATANIVENPNQENDIPEVAGEIFDESDNDHQEFEEEYDDDLEDPDYIPDPDGTLTYNPSTASLPKSFPSKCQYCTKIYKFGATAVEHYEKKHNMHMCTRCFAHFETSEDLEKHQEIHEKDKSRNVRKENSLLSGEYFNSGDDFEKNHIPGKVNWRIRKKAPLKVRKATDSLECDEHFNSEEDSEDDSQEIDPKSGKVTQKARKTTTKVNDEPVNLACVDCDECLPNKTRLKSHLKFAHQKLMCFKCCQVFTTQTEFENHLTVEKHGMVCRICKCECWSRQSWTSHVKSHYSCEVVHVVKPTIDENSTENPLEVNEVTYMVIDRNEEENEKQLQPQKFPFKCHLCDTILLNSTDGFEHYKMHDLYMCSFCFTHLPSKENLKEHTEKQHTFPCPICPFKVISLNIVPLKEHLQTKHCDIYSQNKIPVQCGLCNDRVNTVDELKAHMSSVHNEYLCCSCSKSFNNETTYKEHFLLEEHDYLRSDEFRKFKKRQLMIHTKPRIENNVGQDGIETNQYSCKLCDVVCCKQFFLKRHYLKFHNRLYCLPCDNSFPSHSAIDNHCLTVHGHHTSYQHQCPTCSMYFETEKAILLHVGTVHEKSIKKYECSYCPKQYRKVELLLKHEAKEHENKEDQSLVQCDICKISMKMSKMESHVKQHTKIKDILCTHCGKMFLTTEKLKVHLANVQYKEKHNLGPDREECPKCLLKIPKAKFEKHMKEEHVFEWSYVCNRCQLSFESEEDAWSHCSSVHGEFEGICESKPFTRISPYHCETCQTYMANAAKLKMHNYINHNVHDPIRSKCYRNKKTYCCEKCGDIVTFKSKASHDYVKHKVPLKYPCDQCDKSFYVENKREQHMRKYHGKERNFVCDICDKRFMKEKTVYTHKRRVHFDTYKGLPCPFCDQKFKSIYGQTKHIKMHTANMPFRCEICDLGFHIKVSYLVHMERHEKNLPILPPWQRRVKVVVPDVDIYTIINA